ncbi:MAG: GNAT family N-acetyltransferase [Anaerolineae bacterium]|nr:GNAT family N-acetyltransferase [Anaerolineae bacterium]
MDIQPITLSGAVVRLEPLDARHAEDLSEVATPDLFIYHYPPAEFTPAGWRALIENVRQRPGWCPFAVVLQETGKAIGVTCYLDIQPANRAVEIGFTWIARAYQGTKVNPEMKFLMLRHAFEDQDALRVQIKTDDRNAQSRRAIAKLGAAFEGILRNHMITPDGYHRSTAMFSIIDTEWPSVKANLEARLGHSST